MKTKHLILLTVLVLVIEFSYFVVSDGPFMDYGIPVSEQFSGGNDDRLALQFGALFFAIPVLYGLLAAPFSFRFKNRIFVALYLLSFSIWAVCVIAVSVDTSLWRSILFKDWYLPLYLAAPFVPLAFLIYSAPWLTGHSSRTRAKAPLAGTRH
jgi:hypothetical protein